ncbi:MAG: asparagine synthase, partial [Candidatus Omnitrophica bacterium]|nr:asparagine synthase [Candidatus Omnitrophota bacterium]
MSIDYNKRTNEGGWLVEKNVEIIKKIRRGKNLKTGILLHHNAFNSQKEFRQLDKFLKFVKTDKSLEGIPLSELFRSRKSGDIINRDVLAYYLNYQFVPKPLKLTENSRNPVSRRFNFDYRDAPKVLEQGEDKLCDQLYDAFRKAIKKQLPSKGKPVGLLLSGGMDSAAILHTLRDITDRTIYTLTGTYSKDAGHLISARRIAKRYNTIHDSLIIASGSIKKIDELYRKKIFQPIGDNGFLSTYIMMGKLKEKVDHVISGDGADCLFCGLEMHRLSYLQRKSRGRTGLNHSKRDARYEHYQFGEIFLNEQELGLLFERNCGNIKLEAPLEKVMNKIKARDPVKKQVLLDLHFLVRNRVDYILSAAKASGVNVRLPYLDKDFVHFTLGIPSKFLMRSSLQQKYILKSTFKGKLSQAVLNRKGEGFTPPLKYWYSRNKEFLIPKLIRSKRLGISSEYIKNLISNS